MRAGHARSVRCARTDKQLWRCLSSSRVTSLAELPEEVASVSERELGGHSPDTVANECLPADARIVAPELLVTTHSMLRVAPHYGMKTSPNGPVSLTWGTAKPCNARHAEGDGGQSPCRCGA